MIKHLFSCSSGLPCRSLGRHEGHSATMSDAAPSPDYADENKGRVILAIGWALTMTAGLFVGLRLAIRVHKLRRLRVDDGVMVVSQVIVNSRARVVQNR